MKAKYILVIILMLLASVSTGHCQPTRAEAKLAMQCYNNAFYNQYGTYGPSYKAYDFSDTYKNGRMDFWRQAESIETLIDAYIINNDVDFKNKIQYLYNGMRDGYGTLWSSNKYNDDIIWGSLMCIRAFNIWNDGGMKDMAKSNFDLVWSRAWDTTLGGGLWWTTDKTTKNACVNAPAAICAMYLYYATGDASYKTKAKQIVDWMVSKLFVSSTGEVKGAMNAGGTITEGSRTYTQGTFIGACGELFKYYTSPDYKSYAISAMNYTKNAMCNSSGLLPDEYDTDDTQGFKGIFARWACKFVADYGLASTYGAWLNYNATQAWMYRNSSGLMWGQWWHRASDSYLNAFETTTGVSMMNNIYLYNAATKSADAQTNAMEYNKDLPAEVTISPNPASSYLTINRGSHTIVHVAIIDLEGKICQAVRLDGDDAVIQVGDLVPGIYLVKIKTDNDIITRKLIIHR